MKSWGKIWKALILNLRMLLRWIKSLVPLLSVLAKESPNPPYCPFEVNQTADMYFSTFWDGQQLTFSIWRFPTADFYVYFSNVEPKVGTLFKMINFCFYPKIWTKKWDFKTSWHLCTFVPTLIWNLGPLWIFQSAVAVGIVSFSSSPFVIIVQVRCTSF